MALKFALVLCFVLGAVYAANRNEQCRSVADCKDAGLTCLNGICKCWLEQGFNVAMTWACDADQTCQMLFPGHVCRPTKQCQKFTGKAGYCQPTSSL